MYPHISAHVFTFFKMPLQPILTLSNDRVVESKRSQSKVALYFAIPFAIKFGLPDSKIYENSMV